MIKLKRVAITPPTGFEPKPKKYEEETPLYEDEGKLPKDVKTTLSKMLEDIASIDKMLSNVEKTFSPSNTLQHLDKTIQGLLNKKTEILNEEMSAQLGRDYKEAKQSIQEQLNNIVSVMREHQTNALQVKDKLVALSRVKVRSPQLNISDVTTAAKTLDLTKDQIEYLLKEGKKVVEKDVAEIILSSEASLNKEAGVFSWIAKAFNKVVDKLSSFYNDLKAELAGWDKIDQLLGSTTVEATKNKADKLTVWEYENAADYNQTQDADLLSEEDLMPPEEEISPKAEEGLAELEQNASKKKAEVDPDITELAKQVQNIDDDTLLSWAGYESVKDFEDATDEEYSRLKLIETNYDDILHNRTELDAEFDYYFPEWKEASKKIATTNFEKFKQCYINDLKESHSEEEFPDFFSTIEKTENYNDFVTILSENGMTARDIERVVEDFMTKEAAKKKAGYSLGQEVTVHPHLTTDPYDKRGERGIIKEFEDDEVAVVEFEDGTIGKYMLNALIAAKKKAEVAHETNLKEGQQVYFNNKKQRVIWTRGNSVMLSDEQQPVHITKLQDTNRQPIVNATKKEAGLTSDQVFSLLDILAGYTSEANSLADMQYGSFDQFVQHTKDFLTPEQLAEFKSAVEKSTILASKKVAHDHKVGDWVTLSGTDSEGVSVYIPGARIEDFNPTNPDGTGEYKIEGTWYDENEYYVESIQPPARSSIIVGDTIVTTEEIFDPLIGSFHKGFQDVVVEVQDSGYVRTSALGWVGTNKLEKVAGRMIEDIDSFDMGDEVTYKKRPAKVIKASLDTLSIKFTDGQVRNVPIGDVKKVATELAEDIPVDIVDSATNFARRQYQANVAEAEVIEGLMSQYNLTESQAYVIVEDLGFNEPYGVKNSSSHLLSKEDMQSFASEDKIPVEDVAWVDDPTNESETEEDSSLPKLPHMATKKFKDEEEYQEYFEGSKPLVREDILHEIKNNKSRTEIVDFILNFYDLKPEDVERMVDRSLRRNRHEENDTVGNTGIKASKKTAITIQQGNFEDIIPDEEGIVLLGAGGDPNDWINGVADLWKEEGISTTDNPDDLFNGALVLTTTGGRIDLVLRFKSDASLDIPKMALWRLRFGEVSWISDYRINYSGQHYDDDDDYLSASKKTATGLDKLKEGLRQYIHIIQQRDKDPQEFATELAAVTTFQGLRAFAERWQLADQLDEVVGKTLGASKKQATEEEEYDFDPSLTIFEQHLEYPEDLVNVVKSKYGGAIAEQLDDIIKGNSIEDQNVNALNYIYSFLYKQLQQNGPFANDAGTLLDFFEEYGEASGVVFSVAEAAKKQSAVPKPKPGDPINFDGKSGQVVSVDETDPNNVKFEVSTPDNMTWEVTQQDLTTQGQ